MEYVTNDTNVCNWSQLDEHIVKIAKTVDCTASMFGTFDFDHIADATQTVQKERRARRKADPAIEKRPIAVTQTDDSAKKTTKVELILHKIQSVGSTNLYTVFD